MSVSGLLARLGRLWTRAHARPPRVMDVRRIAPWLLTGPVLTTAEYAELARGGVTHVADLRAEAADDDGALAALGLRWRRWPILDGGPPTTDVVAELTDWLADTAEARRAPVLYLHCQGGVQRTPTVATALLVARGRTLGEALRVVQHLEPRARITATQRAWLERLAEGMEGSEDGSGSESRSRGGDGGASPTVTAEGEAAATSADGEPQGDGGEPEAEHRKRHADHDSARR